jgi:hypothetical protein
MVGILSTKLFLLGKEENVIKAKKEGEQDSKYFRLTFGDGGQNVFSVTCGSRAWELEVTPGKKVMFDPYSLAFGQQYDLTFDIDASSGYNKLKLRTWKSVGSIAQTSKPEQK